MADTAAAAKGSPQLLAEAVGKTILVDRAAAGYGWFVDPTPGADEEFTVSASNHQLQPLILGPWIGSTC